MVFYLVTSLDICGFMLEIICYTWLPGRASEQSKLEYVNRIYCICDFESKNYSVRSKYVNILSKDESNAALRLFSKYIFSVLSKK